MQSNSFTIDFLNQFAKFLNIHYPVIDNYVHTFTYDSLFYSIDKGSVFLFLYDSNRQIIGSIASSPRRFLMNGKSLSIGVVDWLCVHTAHRKKGVASKLIQNLYVFCSRTLNRRVHCFLKDVSPAPFPYLTRLDYKTFKIVDSVSTRNLRRLPKTVRFLEPVYKQLILEQYDYGMFFQNFKDFYTWILNPLRHIYVEPESGHIGIFQDLCMKDVCEIIWTNGIPILNSSEFHRFGFRTILYKSNVGGLPGSFSGSSYLHMFNLKSDCYISNQRINFF